MKARASVRRCDECHKRPVALANRFCSRVCCGRWLGKHITREQRQQWGREGGVTRWLVVRRRLIERLAHLNRDDAIWAAWQAGRNARKVSLSKTQRLAS